MGRRKNFLVDRTEEDDVLDALSLRINETLKTEKKIDDKKNNVYFWLFKFLILLIYLFLINGVLIAFGKIGSTIIYNFSFSLRSVFTFFWQIFIDFSRSIISLYVVFKNLKIFMNSTYYKRLYSNDKRMLRNKNRFFNVVYNVLKYLSVPYLLGLGFFCAIILAIFIVLVYLAINGIYCVSLMFLLLTIFGISYSVFLIIQNKFLDQKNYISRKIFYLAFFTFVLGVGLFCYEFGSYSYDESLPLNFETEKKSLSFNVLDKNDIVIKNNSRYDNINFHIDNDLGNDLRVEFEYFDTAEVSYISHLNKNNDLLLEFDSDINLDVSNIDDIIKLCYETVKNQTIYNYNMFKYPSIRIYASSDTLSKVLLLEYDDDIRDDYED